MGSTVCLLTASVGGTYVKGHLSPALVFELKFSFLIFIAALVSSSVQLTYVFLK